MWSKGKRKIMAVILAGLLAAGMTACASKAEPVKENEETAETAAEAVTEISLNVRDAEITGEGISLEGEAVPTAWSEETDSVVNMGTGSRICFTVPEKVNGKYDIYMNISKAFYPFGTTYVSVSVNDGAAAAMPVYLQRCTKEDYSDLYEMAAYLIRTGAELKEGDIITVTGMAGYEMEVEGRKTSLMPAAFGDLTLKAADTAEEGREENPEDPLSGKKIAWLGSSVTYGMMSGGYSMTNAIADRHEGTECFNFSISATTLANHSESSYVERLKLIDPELSFDLFIVQLSTNDASQDMPLGETAQGKDREAFDDSTVTGAMEWIISYVQETWNCPVMFYTGVYFESEKYGQMVEILGQLQDKWEIGVIDLWNNQEMKDLYGTEAIKEYMADDSHPTYQGYTEWWTPVFEESIAEYLKQQ